MVIEDAEARIHEPLTTSASCGGGQIMVFYCQDWTRKGADHEFTSPGGAPSMKAETAAVDEEAIVKVGPLM